jgi:sulfoxide reductase catalytic subunit YedY
MLIKKPDDMPSSEITPKNVYLNRRNFLRSAALVGGVAATAGVFRLFNHRRRAAPPGEKLTAAPSSAPLPERLASGYFTDEPKTPYDSITTYNNFYEFSESKDAVAGLARNFVSRPWTVTVDGLCSRPRTFDLDDLAKMAPLEERVYRHRCVEAWSMVIPWLGFPIASLLRAVEPLAAAKYVAFQTLLDPARFPNQADHSVLPWPYVEGLRLDEAMHPLAILAQGLYGETLPPQNGAPLRTVIPWKYGFKACKSIVKISLVRDQPNCTWNSYNPEAYGFYSNVNPDIDHPWSQAIERRLPDFTSRPTLLYNGYGAQVAELYAGMDLEKYY